MTIESIPNTETTVCIRIPRMQTNERADAVCSPKMVWNEKSSS